MTPGAGTDLVWRAFSHGPRRRLEYRRVHGVTSGGVLVFYWFLKTVVLGPILKLLFRPWVEGEENIPDEGAAIFASNHLSFSDSIFLPLMVPRRMTFLAKSDYFTG